MASFNMELDSRNLSGRIFLQGQAPRKELYMSKGFQVDTKYQGYVFLDSAQGMFETKDGQRVPYLNMFVFSPVSTHSSDDYQVSGFKAEKRSA